MYRALLAMTLAVGVIGVAVPAGAASCSVELNGGFRCDDGTTLKPDGQGGLRASNGVTLSPDGSGGFRGSNGLILKQNGYGGLNTESGGTATTGGSYGNPLHPRLNQGPDYASSRRAGTSSSGFAAPQANRDCRQDAFGGYRCK